jgi:hypothetical protein
MQRHRGSFLGAFILIALGLWFLAENLNIPLPGLGAMWPIFLILGGLLALGVYLTGQTRDPGQVFVGVAAPLLGVFFFLFTLHLRLPLPGLKESGLTWDDMGRLWPAFPLIGGLAILAQFVVDPRRDWGNFVLGVLAIIVGVVAFPFTLGLWPGELGATLLNLWPVLLIVLGLAALLQALFRKR